MMQQKKIKLLLILIFGILAQVSYAQGVAQQVNQKKKDIVLENVELINSEKLDFSPTFYKNGIVFVSNRKRINSSKKNGDNKDEWMGDNFMSLYYAEQASDGVLANPQEFSVNITTRYHEGPVAFSKDGNRIFFTRNNYINGQKQTNRKGDTLLKIYTALRNGDDWASIEELPFNSADYDQCHPTLSADGNTLYFSSNLEGGQGGMDLYKSEFKNGRWSKPVNLGKPINTAKNEVFPYIHQDGTLYFASNGHGGYGGLDVFSSVQPDGYWRTPANLESPINSLYDDFGFILDATSKAGYFSSSRMKGNGKDDIYSFGIGGAIPQLRTETNVNSSVSSSSSSSSSSNSSAEKEANSLSKIIAGVVTDGTTGQRLMKVKVRLKNPTNGQTMTTLTDDQGEFAFRKTNLYEGHILELSKTGFAEIMETIKIGALRQESTTIKEYFLLMQPDAAPVEIETNTPTPTPTDVPANTDTVAAASSVTPPPVEEIAATSPDILLPKSGTTINYEEGMTGELEVGTTLVLDKILFDYGKHNLKPATLITLDNIVNLLNENATMGIELSAHTDSRGNASYNQRLSRQRAESVVEYLVYKGVNPRRLIPIGSGEQAIRNGCVDGVPCSENQHQENRRLEMKVIRFVN